MSRNRWLRSAPGRRPFTVLAILAIVMGGQAVTPVSASAPEKFGPNTYENSFIGFNCDGFDILIEGKGTDRATVFFDGSGVVTRVVIYARFPRDVLTNTVTGRSIVVRGEFQEFLELVPGTDEWTKTIVGFRYLVNEPGSGATIQEVGRISYADVEETIETFRAGQHDLALDQALWPTFCAALA